MKKIFVSCAIVLASCLASSCGDLLEASRNGKLDGNWKYLSIDTIGGQSKSMVEEHMFLAVQGSILQLRNGGTGALYIFRFTNNNGQLTLTDARVNDREANDPALTDAGSLAPFGIKELEPTFTLSFSGNDEMTLDDGKLRLRLKRF